MHLSDLNRVTKTSYIHDKRQSYVIRFNLRKINTTRRNMSLATLLKQRNHLLMFTNFLILNKVFIIYLSRYKI